MPKTLHRAPPLSLRAFLLLLTAVTCNGCSADAANQQPSATNAEPKVLRYQSLPGVVSFPELAEDLGYLGSLKLEFIGTTSSGPQDIQTVATGDSDVGVAFNGAIIKLQAARAPIRAVIGAYGVDEQTYTSFLVSADSPIRSARDLIGKRVGVNTVGAHAEIVLHEYLSRNGLTDAEIKQVTLIALPIPSIEQALRAKQLEAVALLGPFRDIALARGGLRQLFSDYELFGEFTAGAYVFHQKFIQQHPETVRTFVSGTAKAIEWTRTTARDEVVARYSAIIAKRRRPSETDAIMKLWKSAAIGSHGGVITPRDFGLWADWLVKTGELKPGQFDVAQAYTNEFNPYYTSQ